MHSSRRAKNDGSTGDRAIVALALVAAAMLAGGALVAGCGGNKTDAMLPATAPKITESGKAATTPATATSQPSTSVASSGLSYSGHARLSVGGFTFALSFSLTLGTASANTSGQEPPFVTISAPVSGSATLTNTTSGYTAAIPHIPTAGIFAVYSAHSALCKQTFIDIDQLDPGPRGMCGVDIAELSSGCENGVLTVQSLEPGQTSQLAVWPDGPDAINPASVGSASGGGAAALCTGEANIQIPDVFEMGRLTSSTAQTIINELAQAPHYWMVANESDNPKGCGENDEGERFVGAIIGSRPAGVSGCFGNSNVV